MKLTIVNKLNNREIDQLLDLYANEFWCNTRCRDDVVTMISNTDVIIGVKSEAGDLVGFARVLTDYVYKATVYDVIVQQNWRGRKIGKMLMDSIVNHEKLKHVGSFDLCCLPEMYAFYEQWGFTAEFGGIGFMRRFNHRD